MSLSPVWKVWLVSLRVLVLLALLAIALVPQERRSQTVSQVSRVVVLCAPLYHQNICSYRPVRNLAVRIAERGLPAFRFDWPGCGDSGDAPDPSLATWIGSVHDAIRALRESAGVEEITLVGVRIGATLAMLAALTEPDVSEIALLAPFATGRSYLRELRVFEAMAQEKFSAPDIAPEPIPPGALEAGGFLISAAEVAAFESIELVSADYSSLSAERLLLAVAQPARDVSAFADAVKGSARAEVVETVLPELSHVWDGTLYSYLPRSCSDVICSWLAPSAEGAAL